MHRQWVFAFLLLLPAQDRLRAAGSPPRSLDPDLKLERIAASPDLATPIGCAVDSSGRIFVLESHTHFPKADYPGPDSDRILTFPPVPDGAPVVFASGIRWGMNLAFGPDAALYLTHRNGVVRFAGPDDSGRATARRDIVVMETAGDYPHNGVGGMAFGPNGGLYLGTGENLGLAYVLKGTDGSSVSIPAGAGGIVLRCRPDGTKLERFATGFWNAFGLTFDGHGRLFLVDNDPDSRPPCRLVHVIRGGDYGFQFRHGRDGLSPLNAWDGELPGTLGMVAGTGEAPSSVLDAARTRFPSRYDGTLLVAATWEHRIERYRPVASGSSFRSARGEVVSGDADFRPVSLAAAPDGSIVFTDWVKSDYPVHGHGALWRLSARNPSNAPCQSLPAPAPAEVARLALEEADAGPGLSRWLEAAGSDDPFLRSTAVGRLKGLPESRLREAWTNPVPWVRTSLILAARSSLVRDPGPAERTTGWLRNGLRDPDPEVRLAALVWAIEENHPEVFPEISRVLEGIAPPPLLAETQAVGLRTLAATRTPDAGAVAVGNEDDGVRVVALFPGRDNRRLRDSVRIAGDRTAPAFLRVDAVRDLAGVADAEPLSIPVLQQVATNRSEPPDLRAESILSLTGTHHDHVSSLTPLLQDRAPEVALETARALRPWSALPEVRAALEAVADSDQSSPRLRESARLALNRPVSRPRDEAGWISVLEAGTGDIATGARLFRSPAVACDRCHRIEGRGGALGPDLSAVRRGADRARLLGSLLEPSREVAPQFVDHRVETQSGDVFSGRLVSGGSAGALTLMNGNGQQIYIPRRLIRSNEPGSVSLMPEGLLDAMTQDDVRDLMAYLESRK